MMSKVLIHILIGLLFSSFAAGQMNIILPEDSYDGQSFENLINDIEKNHDFRFFIDDKLITELQVKQNFGDTTLNQVLDRTFEGTGIFFAIYQNRVILTQGTSIKTTIGNSEIKEEETAIKNQHTYLEDDDPADGIDQSKEETGLTVKQTLGSVRNQNGSRTALISGHVSDALSGEPIIGATVYSKKEEVGVSTDLSGYFVIKLPKGNQSLQVSSVGMKGLKYEINLMGDGILDVELEEDVIQLRGAVVVAERNKNVSGIQTGMMRLETKAIKKIPAFAGETDIIKTAILLPGVQSVGEGASGFNVRGGSTDQNLILLNEIPIFNSSHLFGFFSSFNSDIVRDFNLYKSGIPARYGGRVSSVLDVNMKSGNTKKFGGSAGLGPVTARGMIEGPLGKERGSFVIGGRTTYSDWILKRIKNSNLSQSSAYFFDVNLNATYKINHKNEISISSYYSQDFFKLRFDTTYTYKNTGASLKWKHMFNKKLIGHVSANYSLYEYRITGEEESLESFTQHYSIDYKELATHFSYYPSEKHKIKFGLNGIYYTLLPGRKSPHGDQSLVIPVEIQTDNALEASLYVSDEYNLNDHFKFYAGLRYSNYFYLGPQQVYSYLANSPLEDYNIMDTLDYDKNEVIRYYGGPEVRLAARYQINYNNSLKISYNRNRQYLHMLTNSTAVSPTDTWKLSDYHIRPQVGDQYTMGYYHDFKNNTIQTSVEVYYKRINDILEYKGGAELLLNDKIETDLVNAFGYAYGAEFLVEKRIGRINGWVSYTYSRTLIKSDSPFDRELINNGEYFPANHDKPHDFTAVCNYQFTRRFSASGNMTYSTGRPITYPAAGYTYRNIPLLHYTNRNEYRLPDYFRVDISLNLEGNLRSKKIAHSFWSFSVYNLTGRSNVYSSLLCFGERSNPGL